MDDSDMLLNKKSKNILGHVLYNFKEILWKQKKILVAFLEYDRETFEKYFKSELNILKKFFASLKKKKLGRSLKISNNLSVKLYRKSITTSKKLFQNVQGFTKILSGIFFYIC